MLCGLCKDEILGKPSWLRLNKEFKICKSCKDKRRNEEWRELANETRRLVLQKYGNKCSCCGELNYEFLSIDHVNGGGCKERKKKHNLSILMDLLRYPELNPKYRILCHNCNQSFGFYGYCPHKINANTTDNEV